MRTAPGQAPPTAHTGQQQPCRSVALLSRVRTQNGNDRLRAPPTNPARTAQHGRPRALCRPARRPRPLPLLPPGTPTPG